MNITYHFLTLPFSNSDIYMSVDADLYLGVVSFPSAFKDTSHHAHIGPSLSLK